MDETILIQTLLSALSKQNEAWLVMNNKVGKGVCTKKPKALETKQIAFLLNNALCRWLLVLRGSWSRATLLFCAYCDGIMRFSPSPPLISLAVMIEFRYPPLERVWFYSAG